jgi:hypothetical protein
MKQEHRQIALTIKEQLRYNDYLRPARWAAREYSIINEGDHGEEIGKVQAGLSFKVSDTNNLRQGYVAVYLKWDDTYTVRVVKVWGRNIKQIALKSGIYCDNLGEVIDDILESKNNT